MAPTTPRGGTSFHPLRDREGLPFPLRATEKSDLRGA
jgi:hypothetical protein